MKDESERCPINPTGEHDLQGGWCPQCGAVYFYPGWGKPAKSTDISAQ